MSHSEYLKLVFNVDNINLLSTINGHLFAKICEVTGEKSLITNSIGFYYLVNPVKKEIDSFVIPISAKRAIYISKFDKETLKSSYYTLTDEHVKLFNKYCFAFEKQIGNGMLFSTNINTLENLKHF